MSPTPVQITRRPDATPAITSALPQTRQPEPAGIVISTVEQISAGNQRGCGDSNPYN